MSSFFLFLGASLVLTCCAHNHSIYFLGLLRTCRRTFAAKGTIIYTAKRDPASAAHRGPPVPVEPAPPAAPASPSVTLVGSECPPACGGAPGGQREDNLIPLGILGFRTLIGKFVFPVLLKFLFGKRYLSKRKKKKA